MRRFALPACLSTLLALPCFTQGEHPPRFRAAIAFADFMMNAEVSAKDFVAERLDAAFVERIGGDVLRDRLESLREEVAADGLDDVMSDTTFGACLMFVTEQGELSTLLLRIAKEEPHGITDVWVEGAEHLDPAAEVEPLPPPLTWDNFEERMAAEVAAGFSGALLIARDGETLVDRGFGLANREKDIACSPETIFAIGSTPIDFTKAGILLLAQDGALELDQPITDFFDDVPADKRGTTIRHLMTGASGLRNFHGLPTDSDPDHFWIDREEAVRRILAHELLFAPGTDNEHSHSAWGLLAAILEITSGLSYQEFTRELLFEPAGMKSTGFFGEPISEERLAIGYGELSDGTPNAPPFWGPTSWLVMGSGGMVSTTGDMRRWMDTLRRGDILEPEWLAHYWAPPGAFLSGGDMFGFEIVYTEHPTTQYFLISNSVGAENRRHFNRLARDLAALR